MTAESYKRLAERLNQLPEGFPPTSSGSEIRLLQKLFTPEEAELASHLRLTPETPTELADRLGLNGANLSQMLKGMARRGLVEVKRQENGIAFGLLPFVVGIYEYQIGRIDGELAELFEAYYQEAFVKAVEAQPAVHRVVPVKTSVDMNLQVHPYESVVNIVEAGKAWGVFDCICRNQKALIGDPCEHPVDVCMTISPVEGAYDNSKVIRGLSKEEAYQTLQRAADAGLVHSVSNTKDDVSYICNCCTCSCGILRGMKEFGIANVVAQSPYVSIVDVELCNACELCLEACQFDAISHDMTAEINPSRCVGCGLCVLTCPDQALSLTRRPEEDITYVPANRHAWRMARAEANGVDLKDVL